MKLFTFVQAAQTGPGLQPKLQSPAPRPGGLQVLVRVPKRRQRCAHQRPLSLSPEDHGA